MSSDAGSAVCKEIAIPGLAVGKSPTGPARAPIPIMDAPRPAHGQHAPGSRGDQVSGDTVGKGIRKFGTGAHRPGPGHVEPANKA